MAKSEFLVAGGFFEFGADAVELHEAPLELVEEEIDDGGGEEGEHLRDEQAADDGDAQGLAQFGADAHADGKRQSAEHGGEGGHHDGTEAHQACLVDGFDGRQALFALGLQGKVDHHDGVLLHDSDEQENADQGHDAEIGAGDEQGENRADAGGRQRGENGERMDQALVKDAEHDVDGDESGEDEIGFVLERLLEGLRRALEGGVNGGGHAHIALGLFERGYGIAQRDVGCEIKRECHCWILALVIDGERGALLLPVGDG